MEKKTIGTYCTSINGSNAFEKTTLDVQAESLHTSSVLLDGLS